MPPTTPSRRDLLKTLTVTAAAVAATRRAAAAPSREKRPNVILVITDDQGYGDLSCHGNTVLRTPSLDAMHADSVRLTDFHVDPLCSPTRAALMTGRYATRTGVWGTTWGRSMPYREEVMMPAVFAAGGYRTGVFGKWHLGDTYPFRPQDRGFQEVLVHGGGGVGQTPDYWGNDYFDDTYFHNGKPKKFTGYCTDVWFSEAMKFVQANRDRPFFVYLTTNAPHGPYRVADKYAKPYRGNRKVGNANFYGMIANIDENMARLRKHLKALGIDRDTLLIFMTDNGTAGGGFHAGMRGRKGSTFDGGHRVPCFLHWPGGGLAGGRDVNRLTAHLDLLPTLIDLCGLKQPAGVKLDGRSLAPLLTGPAKGWPDRTLVVQFQQSTKAPTKWRAAVMTDRWRLVGQKTLHDIRADAGQQTDVAGKHPDVVTALHKAYENWWADMAKTFNKVSRIIIGSDQENPARLTCFDWHTTTPWNQGHIRSGAAINSFWAVEIAREGEYEFALRRWPAELDKPITAPAGGKAVRATKARLKIADVDVTEDIPAGASAVTFRVKLKAGPARLQTWLLDAAGKGRGAYYVHAKRL